MAAKPWVECSFFIPLRKDKTLAEGTPHDRAVWQWFEEQLITRFGGSTTAPGLNQGLWTDPKTGAVVRDESRRYLVAVPKERVNQLRSFLCEVSREFFQQCIYFSVAGRVEFVEPKE